MSSLFNTLSCCWFWLIAGILIGWLLNRWLCSCCCKTKKSAEPSASLAAKVADTPSATPAQRVVAEPPKATTIDLVAAKAAGFTIKNANDLTIIEGIGPKINALFKENGVNTFAELAAQTVPQMRAILDKGGSRFRIANPETWAQQSALAAENKWAELKKLQGELSGGVRK
ncbi:MAG TPA: hypothetical protein DCO68_11390 [Methylophilaceae bacterium]|nr:hypothetical protein [Methylophilaceae bacterium]HAJ72671.1 hypothetical protein [Methylophilaceae bacterium]